MELAERQKLQAIKMMKELIKYKPIIKSFADHDQVTYSLGTLGATYNIEGEPELVAAIEQLKARGYLPYHATLSMICDMEIWSIMVVSQYEEDWEDELQDAKDGYVFCYCLNTTTPECSEFGTCFFVPSAAGDVKRVG